MTGSDQHTYTQAPENQVKCFNKSCGPGISHCLDDGKTTLRMNEALLLGNTVVKTSWMLAHVIFEIIHVERAEKELYTQLPCESQFLNK